MRPVRWETEICGKPPQEITLETATGLQFAQKELRVKAGQGVALTVVNPDSMPHNWVLTKPDALETVTLLSAKMASEPDAYFRHYVPETMTSFVTRGCLMRARRPSSSSTPPRCLAVTRISVPSPAMRRSCVAC
jgi:hypothetical protein